MRRAHVEHAVHGCDAGRVEAQRLVERRRALPSRKGGMELRGGAGEARAGKPEGSGRGRCKQRIHRGELAGG